MALASRSEDVYESALDSLFRGTNCTRAAILVFDGDDVMRFTAFRGLSEAYRRAVEGHTPWMRETRDPMPIVIHDVETTWGNFAALLRRFQNTWGQTEDQRRARMRGSMST